MVSQSPPGNGSGTRARLVAAAAAEFAARGFDGAKVDRIAARARINKAMLYYHFANKSALYREILHGTFSGVAAAVRQVRDAGGPPDVQIRGVVGAVIREAAERPHFPAIWLREIAEGGRHLDDETVGGVKEVIQTVAGILGQAPRAGRGPSIHPFVAHLGIVAPIVLFAASAPLRKKFSHLMPRTIAPPTINDVANHVVAVTLAALALPEANRSHGVWGAAGAKPRATARASGRERVGGAARGAGAPASDAVGAAGAKPPGTKR